MRFPPSQSEASRLVVRLAVVPVRGRLMRSQTSELGRRICSPEMLIPDAQGLSNPESSIPGGAIEASRRGTGGVDDCGTAEEDGPVTWETPDRPVARSGRRRTGDPLRRAVGGKRTDGRLHDVSRGAQNSRLRDW